MQVAQSGARESGQRERRNRQSVSPELLVLDQTRLARARSAAPGKSSTRAGAASLHQASRGFPRHPKKAASRKPWLPLRQTISRARPPPFVCAWRCGTSIAIRTNRATPHQLLVDAASALAHLPDLHPRKRCVEGSTSWAVGAAERFQRGREMAAFHKRWDITSGAGASRSRTGCSRSVEVHSASIGNARLTELYAPHSPAAAPLGREHLRGRTACARQRLHQPRHPLVQALRLLIGCLHGHRGASDEGRRPLREGRGKRAGSKVALGVTHCCGAVRYFCQTPRPAALAWFSAATNSGEASAVACPPPLNRTTRDKSCPPTWQR
jgi:hypothetical protein